MIEISNVKKIYSKDVAIGPINLNIPTGGITSFIGPNGAGKTTLIMMIGRLLSMDEGMIKVSNLDVSKTDSSELSKVISILRQENNFVTRLTVRQLVGFGRFPYSQGAITKEDEKIINKYLDFLDLTNLQNRYLDELSGGQRQRAYVAMILCQETDYILLDEPLNNLDISRSVQMMKHLREIADKLNKTIILVMHDINFAARYSDKICAMKNGEVVVFDDTEKVMNSRTLSEIYDTEIEILQTDKGIVAIY
ncbi:iron ABC transporter ATP-binding protein [Helcococcus bovis]|uniref:iron ABC transporter ATP-binding protein n=1 Tax=Helcococcus bovis TaxID=3153252 RepID=UPI0038BD7004